MAATTQTFDVSGYNDIQDVLKEYYAPALADTVYSQTVLLDRLRKRQGTLVGKQLVWPIRAGRNWGVGPRGEVGVYASATNTLPPTGAQKYSQGVLNAASYWGRFAITGEALDASQGDMAAMIDVLDKEMTGLTSDLAKAVNRDLFSSGKAGYLALLKSSPSSGTTFTVDQTARLEVGMPIVIASIAAGATGEAATITAIDETTKEIEVDTNVSGTLDVDGVFLQGLHNTNVSSAYGNACESLNSIISASGTYAGINRATTGNEFWQANVLDGSAGLDFDLMRQAIRDGERKGNGKHSLIVGSFQQWQKIGNLVQPDRRWQSSIQTLDGGWRAIEFEGVPVVYDFDCDDDKLYFIDESTMELCEQTPLGFEDRDGLIMRWAGQGTNGVDIYEVAAKYRFNLKCDNPAANSVINNLPTA
jgi:hypothetical protein